ncbi:unnamed protein product [Closterium sp. NIES-64]|nr:unnamed protein product [Closterium sp. NIES-64]
MEPWDSRSISSRLCRLSASDHKRARVAVGTSFIGGRTAAARVRRDDTARSRGGERGRRGAHAAQGSPPPAPTKPAPAGRGRPGRTREPSGLCGRRAARGTTGPAGGTRATAGEMGRVGAGDQVIGPRDEESRVAGALTAAANAQTGTEGEKRAEQAIDNVWLGDRASGDNATGGPEIGSSMPRGEVNVVSAVIAASEAIEARRDVPHGDSPARHRAPLSNGDEANVPGAGAGPGR